MDLQYYWVKLPIRNKFHFQRIFFEHFLTYECIEERRCDRVIGFFLLTFSIHCAQD